MGEIVRSVSTLAFSPDGRYALVAGGEPFTARVLDVEQLMAFGCTELGSTLRTKTLQQNKRNSKRKLKKYLTEILYLHV